MLAKPKKEKGAIPQDSALEYLTNIVITMCAGHKNIFLECKVVICGMITGLIWILDLHQYTCTKLNTMCKHTLTVNGKVLLQNCL